MYILVNKEDVIVGSAVNKPSEYCCSKNMQRVYEIPNEEYSPELIGSQLISYESVKMVSD